MKQVLISASLCILLGAGLAGCDASSALAPGYADTALVQNERPAGLRFQPGDKLKITVFGEDRLTGEYQIDADGAVSLPLVGTLRAAGLKKADLESILARKLRAARFVNEPKVTVDIASFRPFYVLGEVERPGQFPYVNGLNVLSAIAVAGGATYRSSETHVLIQRSGERQLREYPSSPDVPVYPGDLVKVPERIF